ncbi:lytic murein transglycosylase [Tessaracoccus sp. OS52]|uniref:lytic murein transglycosylase n=1 Tax=Tessaracoccus sp. OS52 TaxID=2886691 RepID=UPI001D0FE3C8|nr:lytic murein transglycosylase [Tessaracoccus sp. OS52]MCC2594176.1 lytic murein transglycosylase [Tessaracoccus sp. OS52]
MSELQPQPINTSPALGDPWLVDPPRRDWVGRLLACVSGGLIGVVAIGSIGMAQLQGASPVLPDPGQQLAPPDPVAPQVPRPLPTAPLPEPAVVPTPSLPAEPAPGVGSSGADPEWVARVAARTGIPPRALSAYAAADLIVDAEQPACGLGWTTLAGIGWVESAHGSHAGSVLGSDGYPRPQIRGVALDGDGVAAIPDTEGGVWDGDAVWDRAVGPMQFIPSTWQRWGADGNGDGWADPNQIDDAALAAARYLCASGPMTTTSGWRRAVFSYNNLSSYVDNVALVAGSYASRTGGT